MRSSSNQRAVWVTAAVMAASLLAATVMAADADGPAAACLAVSAAAGKPGCSADGKCRFPAQLP